MAISSGYLQRTLDVPLPLYIAEIVPVARLIQQVIILRSDGH
jgi:hypothetical protein